MKKCLIAIAMVLSLSMNVEAVAQKHRHTPRTEQVDSTKKDAIEAFSDTTTVADSVNSAQSTTSVTRVKVYDDDDVEGMLKEVFSNLDSNMIFGMITALGILTILFVVFPIIIIIGVVYLINRNRKEKYKLAQMAMQNGQPIPDALLKEKSDDWDRNDYQVGIRQMFTGVGLAIFLGIVAGDIGFGIGALVFCIGLGKWYIARKSRPADTNAPQNDITENIKNDNQSNI